MKPESLQETRSTLSVEPPPHDVVPESPQVQTGGSMGFEVASMCRRAAARSRSRPTRTQRHPYATEVGDRGGRLSLGQQQRVALARAFLKDAPILLLDEPTAALDLQTEADLLEGIEQLMAGRTVVIVAHRLSTIRHADTIHVLDRGAIVESGAHDTLLAQGGQYASLWRTMDRPNDPKPPAT